jgi:hypothetical protein
MAFLVDLCSHLFVSTITIAALAGSGLRLGRSRYLLTAGALVSHLGVRGGWPVVNLRGKYRLGNARFTCPA